MVLPVNIDATYPERSAGDAAHQQHHDEIHAAVNGLPAVVQDAATLEADVAATVGTAGALDTALSASIVEHSGRRFLPEQFGAPETYGTAVDDTAAVQAAIDAAIAANGEVFLNRAYHIPNGGLVANGKVTIKGKGGFGGNVTPGSSTGLVCSSATADCLSISGDGSTVADFSIIHTGTNVPTAGSGLRFTRGWFSHTENMAIANFWINLRHDDSCYHYITNNTLLDPYKYGFYERNDTNMDYGEFMFVGNVVSMWRSTRTPDAAIRWERGGGLKFTGNKINGGIQPAPGLTNAGKFVIGIDLAPADGSSTSVGAIVGNSIENCTVAVRLKHPDGSTGSGLYSKLTIVGNEIAIHSGQVIQLWGIQSGKLGDVVVSDNVFTDCGGIYLKNVEAVTVGTNRFVRVGSSTGPVLTVDTGAHDVHLEPQHITGTNLSVFRDMRATAANANDKGARAAMSLSYARAVPAVTSTATYVSLFKFSVSQYYSGLFAFSLVGNVKGVGGTLYEARRSFIRDTTGAAALATIGTDVQAGALFDVLFDTATTAGEVIVKVRLSAAQAGSLDLNGTARLTINGNPYEVWRS